MDVGAISVDFMLSDYATLICMVKIILNAQHNPLVTPFSITGDIPEIGQDGAGKRGFAFGFSVNVEYSVNYFHTVTHLCAFGVRYTIPFFSMIKNPPVSSGD